MRTNGSQKSPQLRTKNGHKKLTAQKSATQSNCTKFKLTAPKSPQLRTKIGHKKLTAQKSATQSNCTKIGHKKLTAPKSPQLRTKIGHKKLTAQKSATQSNCTKFKLRAQLLVEQASRLLIIKRLSDLNN